jgi:hypothetical protein
MRRHRHDGRKKKSVRLCPGVEALECRKLLSALGPMTTSVAVSATTPPVAANATTPSVAVTATTTSPRPSTGTEVIKSHKVVAIHVKFSVDMSLALTGDTQQYSLEAAQSRRHQNIRGARTVPLASATYDEAHRTLTLKPTAPAPVRRYWVVTQASQDGSDPPGGQVTWTTQSNHPPSPTT